MDYQVPTDVFCHQCDYNLRALPATGKCPECGTSIEDTLRRAPSRAVPYRKEMLAHIRRVKVEPFKDEFNCTVDGVLFVLEAAGYHFNRMTNLEAERAPT